MLNIALLDACPVQLSKLAVALEKAVHALDPHMMRLTAADAGALPASFADFDLVLLAGVETPACAPCKPGLDAGLDQEAADRSIRTALAMAAVSYRVLYGTAAERLAHALQAVESLLPAADRTRQIARPGGLKNQPWVWMCEKCSDPQCEHRLLTALLAQRDSASSTPGQQQARPLLNR